MPTALARTFDPPPPMIPPRKRWTRAECATLESSGIWDRQKLELIEGELISKMGKNRRHVVALMRMMQWLTAVFGWDKVNQEAPIDVAPDDNQSNHPEPDAIVFRQAGRGLQAGEPQPGDLDLVVEVADTTLRFDLGVKAALYARAAVAEYWVVDLNGRRLIVHRIPDAAGYRSIVAYNENEKVAPLAAPTQELLVGDVLAL